MSRGGQIWFSVLREDSSPTVRLLPRSEAVIRALNQQGSKGGDVLGLPPRLMSSSMLTGARRGHKRNPPSGILREGLPDTAQNGYSGQWLGKAADFT